MGINLDKKLKFRYRMILTFLLVLTFISIVTVYRFYVINKIPDTIYLRRGQEESVSFPIPVSAGIHSTRINEMSGKNISVIQDNANSEAMNNMTEDMDHLIVTPVSRSIALVPGSNLTYQMTLKLFGVIPVKSVDLNVVSPIDVHISGVPIGIYVKTKGVMVIDTGTFKNDKNEKVNPSGEILQAGDYILQVNDQDVKGKRNL